jgi:iron complex outermembrane recepter protein
MYVDNFNAQCRTGSVRRLNLTTASGAALLVMLAASGQSAYAQTDDTEVESVTVSSSRIMVCNFDGPTPTTVISADDLLKQANPNVFTTITELPSLMGSTGTNTGNGGSSNGVNGLSTLNIRGLGTNRNLVLIDGERVVPSSSLEVVDVSLIPQMLIQRVDVVTGGASASRQEVRGLQDECRRRHHQLCRRSDCRTSVRGGYRLHGRASPC